MILAQSGGLPLNGTGLPGATAPTRYAGGTAGGAPVTGTFAAGDFIIDETGSVWVCTAAGTPGTWTQVSGGGGGSATNYAPTGLAGATAASRYAGATAAGAPVTGTFAVGDFVIDQSGTIWICITAGSPGTWQQLVNTLGTQTIGGAKTFASPLSMGTNKITAVANGTAATDAAAFGQTPAGGAVVPGQFLCAPSAYAPGAPASLTTSSATMAAVSSANVSTGNFTVPPSGSFLVTVNLVAKTNTANARFAFGLAAHGTVTPVIGNLIVNNDNGTSVPRLYSYMFLVTGQTPGAVLNLDLLFAVVSTDLLTVTAFGQSTTTPTLSTSGTDGAPVTMTVQAV